MDADAAWGRARVEEEIEPMWQGRGAVGQAAPTWRSLLQAAPTLVEEPGSGGGSCDALRWEECGPSCWWCADTNTCTNTPGECFSAIIHPADDSTPRAGGWATLLVFATVMLSCAAMIWLTRDRQREALHRRPRSPGIGYGQLSSGRDQSRARSSSREGAWSGAAASATPGQHEQPEGQRLLDVLA